MLNDYSDVDILERGALAKQIANEIDELRSKKSFTFGILGEWGKGKSTLLGQINEKLEESKKSIVLCFNPWLFSNKKDLVNLFFSELQKQLLKEEEVDKSILVELETYAEDLNFDKDLDQIGKYSSTLRNLGALFTAILRICVFLIPLELAKVFFPIKLDQYSSYLVTAMVVVVYIICCFELDQCSIVTFFHTIGKKLKRRLESFNLVPSSEYPIHTLKDNLCEKLNNYSKNIVVIIDDIDRLEKEEILQILKLIKNTADFPRIVFLIALDENIVHSKLISDFTLPDNDKSIKIIDKFIQAPIYLPENLDNDIYEILIKSINQEVLTKIATKNVEFSWDSGEFQKFFFNNNLCKVIKNIRDVVRLINSLRISLPLMEVNGSLEVNINDFIILEILKVFYNKAFEFLSEDTINIAYYGFDANNIKPDLKEKDDVRTSLSTNYDDPNYDSKIVGNFKKKLGNESEEAQALIAKLIDNIFPGEKTIRGSGNKYRSYGAKNRISCIEHVNKYFCLSTLELRTYSHTEKVPQLLSRDFDALVLKSNDFSALAEHCNSLCERVGRFKFLLRLRSFVESFHFSDSQKKNIIKCLFEILENEPSSIFDTSKELNNVEDEIFSIIDYFIDEKNIDLLLFDQESLYGIAWSTRHSLFKGTWHHRTQFDSQIYLDKLIAKISDFHNAGVLFDQPKALEILLIWYRTVKEENIGSVKEIIKNCIQFPQNALSLISSRILYTTVGVSYPNGGYATDWELSNDLLKELLIDTSKFKVKLRSFINSGELEHDKKNYLENYIKTDSMRVRERK